MDVKVRDRKIKFIVSIEICVQCGTLKPILRTSFDQKFFVTTQKLFLYKDPWVT